MLLRAVEDGIISIKHISSYYLLMSKSAHLVTGAAAAKLAKDVNATFGPEKAQMVVSGSVYMSVFFLCLPHTDSRTV